MIDKDSITHHIQRHILEKLAYTEVARFSELRPKNTDSNLYSYHLTKLLKQGAVVKVDGGYTLGESGLLYVDRVSSSNKKVRTQPKIITMIVIQNSNGDVLLQKRTKQPYINQWTLPYGKVHIEDASTLAAAKRELEEKVGLVSEALERAGDCYIRTSQTSTLAHIFRLYEDDIPVNSGTVWARPHRLTEYSLAPAVEEIVARTFFKDPFFFEEFDA